MTVIARFRGLAPSWDALGGLPVLGLRHFICWAASALVNRVPQGCLLISPNNVENCCLLHGPLVEPVLSR